MDIVESFVPDVSPTPPLSPTPTPTVTSTPTNTPSVTPTNTVTPTISVTPSPNPLCPQEVVVSNHQSLSELNGNYNRVYPGSDYGYMDFTTQWIFVPGDNSGINYPVFVNTSPGDPFTATTLAYDAYSSVWNIFEGSVIDNTIVSDTIGFTSSTISYVGGTYPTGGQKYEALSPSSPLLYLAYPVSCPTATPTPTNTSTPTQTATNTPTPSITPSSSPAAFDSDAATYLAAVIAAGGTVDSTMSAATNTLFTSLKTNNLYDKMQLFYPLIGGTEGSHSIMGKRTSGTTYDIVWGGAMTHSVSGITGVGTSNSWGDLGFYGSGTTLGNRHFSLYSFINNTTARYDLSSDENGIILGYGSSSWYGLMDATNYDPMAVANTTGMYITIEPALNTQTNFRNGTNTGTFARTSFRYPSTKFAIGAKNSGAGQAKAEYSLRGYSWISIGLGLTDGEAGTLTTIINTFQTSLGRNVY